MDVFFTEEILKKGEILLVIPPFSMIETPSIGVHTLKACVEKRGFPVEIAYVNLALASVLGEENYQAIMAPSDRMLGELFFANAAYGTQPFQQSGNYLETFFEVHSPVDIEHIKETLRTLEDWINQVADEILQFGYKIIGFSTTFSQTASSIALINRVKSKNPEIVTVIGGANCEGEMAEGILSLSGNIDYVFSGEGEEVFPGFIERVLRGEYIENKIINGSPCMDINQIPVLDYTSYYKQINRFISDSKFLKTKSLLLPYESSRGCWWGQKHQCNFCGLNGKNIGFREKTTDKIVEDLKVLLNKHPSNNVFMVDNIMPYHSMNILMDCFKNELSGTSFFYEVKSNLTLEQLDTLKNAGVDRVQPGIEAISTKLLKRMNKGVQARDNLRFLKNSRILEINAAWNLLYAFPGDTHGEYEETLRLIPLIVHLQPPNVFGQMTLQRFSKYYCSPDEFGIKNIRPVDTYRLFLPRHAEIAKLAYYFWGEYEYFSRDDEELIIKIKESINRWKKLWNRNPVPKLQANRISKDRYLLMDTRGLQGTKTIQAITHKQAMAALTDTRAPAAESLPEEMEWAIKQKLIVEVDSWYVSLVTAPVELILELRRQGGNAPGGVAALFSS
ncbi:ribosomal peptide maturation radical SAM protein 1 [Anaerobacterium chartisolvens]|uniref:Ribosomal peptide maturation radical SAM protein 1 n=1 Tax=Anaerobacterium chartisolvens TaxID=1297424 RepID=A0A369AGS0_9FIRM|nr:RiPP maturation radical SAM C-methyltransferase [Anaerobacterium chartisolvens]RCX08295.1 ribosomal peptide maturation radical SAM protein 1 [Anaerobacterium chartisolvens]